MLRQCDRLGWWQDLMFIHSVLTDLPPMAVLGAGAWPCCTCGLGLGVPSGRAGLGAGRILFSHCSCVGRCSGGPWGQGCARSPSSHSLQQLICDEPVGQPGVTGSGSEPRLSQPVLCIPNCPWPPRHGLVSPGDSWAARFLPACAGSSLCGEAHWAQFVCL